MKCERCDRDILREISKTLFDDNVWLCMTCLFLIVKEWNIKKKEVNFLGQGRIYCSVNNKANPVTGYNTGEYNFCIYEVNHIGKHSWEI